MPVGKYSQRCTINTVPYMHFCVVLYQHDDLFGDFVICSTVFNIFNVYQAFNFREINNLFVASARFCEIYFILQVLLYTFNFLFNFAITEVYTHNGTFEYSVAYCGIAEGGGGGRQFINPITQCPYWGNNYFGFQWRGGGICKPLHAVTPQWRLKYILVSVHSQNIFCKKKYFL